MSEPHVVESRMYSPGREARAALMTKYKLTIQYDGGGYSGWQIQKGRTTIQGTIREALARLTRSEEHTSELQSRLHLVCRLLLEKKHNDAIFSTTILGRFLDTRTHRHTDTR